MRWWVKFFKNFGGNSNINSEADHGSKISQVDLRRAITLRNIFALEFSWSRIKISFQYEFEIERVTVRASKMHGLKRGIAKSIIWQLEKLHVYLYILTKRLSISNLQGTERYVRDREISKYQERKLACSTHKSDRDPCSMSRELRRIVGKTKRDYCKVISY